MNFLSLMCIFQSRIPNSGPIFLPLEKNKNGRVRVRINETKAGWEIVVVKANFCLHIPTCTSWTKSQTFDHQIKWNSFFHALGFLFISRWEIIFLLKFLLIKTPGIRAIVMPHYHINSLNLRLPWRSWKAERFQRMFLTGNSHPIVTRGSHVSRVPPHHTLPAVINLHGRSLSTESASCTHSKPPIKHNI